MLKFFALDPEDTARRLARAVTQAVEGHEIHNAVLHVDAPRAGLRGTWAGGIADIRTGAAMRPDTPFLAASIGKLAVATTVFSLATDRALTLDDPITRWIDTGTLEGLPVVGGQDAVGRISVRMLLANRSGLPDYFDDDKHPSADGAPSLARLMVSEPQRTWTRDALIAYAREHYRGFAAPGERFLYSDLNWDLLGLVLEGVTGRPFAEIVRERVLGPLGMTGTWYHAFEPVPAGVAGYADVFAGEENLARLPSLTFDQAGGGLATTAEDLGRLLRGLEAGQPVAFEELARDWTDDAMSRGLDYGYGTWRWRPGRIFPLAWQLPQLVGVSGSTNSFAYLTARGDVVAGTLDQADDPSRHVRFVLSKVLPVLGRVRR